MSSNQDDLYHPRYVAFLDILGFSDLVAEADKEPVIRHGVGSVIQTMRTTLVDNPHIDFRITQFSDNIVLSVKPHLYGLYAIFNGSRMLFENLLQRGVLLRGGITLGNLIHTNETLFGPGLITAYKMDLKGASPRIALDKSIIDEVEAYGVDMGLEHEVEQDDVDLMPMLHTLRDFELYGPPFKPGMVVLEEPAQWIGTHIHKLATDMALRPEVRAKWRWMERYWDRSVGKRGILPLAKNAQWPPVWKA